MTVPFGWSKPVYECHGRSGVERRAAHGVGWAHDSVLTELHKSYPLPHGNFTYKRLEISLGTVPDQ
ncbi:MAG TPA: hypothetical protein VFP71_06740 [Candidatus Angelobacter sp.]|nr:hypothetical protein [Candidatus Angelobacter sp.]